MNSISQLLEKNPEARALALGMELLQRSNNGNFELIESLYEAQKRRADALQNEVDYLRPYADRYFRLRELLQPDKELH